MQSSDRWLIRTDGDRSIGMGHVIRCLVLAREVRRRGGEAIFALGFSDESVIGRVTSEGFEYRSLSFSPDPEKEIAEWGSGRFCVIVLDMSHHEALQHPVVFEQFVSSLKDCGNLIALVDGADQHAISEQIDLDVDVLIKPYFGENAGNCKGRLTKARKAVCGSEYALLDEAYARYLLKPRLIREPANRVLISFGGADPRNLTVQTMDALARIRGRRLDVRVVVGTVFGSAKINDIETRASNLAHQCVVVRAPDCLAEHMWWSDLSVSHTGLTKYELAATGTPSIQVSIDAAHHRINERFGEAGTALYLGLHSEVDMGQLAREIEGLLNDSVKRRAMSERGRELIDGRGVSRLVSELEHIAHDL